MNRNQPLLAYRNIVFLSVLLGLVSLCTTPSHAYLSLIRQGVESKGVPNSGDLYGYVIATGDFNNDGYDDVAVSSPWEANGLIPTAAHGIVIVNFGGPYGLKNLGAAELSPGVPLDNAIKFGDALATGDFNGDGFDDLAVGLPSLDEGTVTDAGAVWIYEGYAGGIQLAPSLMMNQTDVGATPVAFDHFGFTLASGDFDNNSYDDLAITSIGKNGGMGLVTIVYGVGASGLSTSTAAEFSPAMLANSIEIADGWFGKALVAGDMDDDGTDDLVVGAPKTSPIGMTVAQSGRIYGLYGSPVGLATTDTWFWDAVVAGNIQESRLELGWSLAMGSFFDNIPGGSQDIVVGAPGYEESGQNDTGAVYIVVHKNGARGVTVSLLIDAITQIGFDGAEVNDRMGETVAAGDFDGDGYTDFAVGVPSNNVAEQTALGIRQNAGSVYLYTGGDNTIFDNTRITHTVLNDHIYDGDNLGRGLAFGDFDNSGRDAIAIGAPRADYLSYDGSATISNAGRVYIHAPWRQPRNRPHRGSAAFDCDGHLVYAQRAWQRMRPASTTKTMTLQLACDSLDQGQNPNQIVTIPSWVANSVNGSQAGHLTGDQLTFYDLFKTMMTVSGNDSAMYLAALISGEGLNAWTGWSSQSPTFAASMEAQAVDWGMSSVTSFTNAAGIDSGDHYTTPFDFALMSYQAIEDACVKLIVDRPSWVVPVQRLGASGSPGLYGQINLAFTNGFVNGVRSQNPSTVGMKGGLTPGALRTGVYNSYVPLAGAHNAASGFGVWGTGNPLPATIADCNSCLGAELLAIADTYCLNDAFPDQILAPDPEPGPWAQLQNFSSGAADTASGIVFNAVGSEANQLERLIQVDVLRVNQAWPEANVTAVLRHTSEVCIPAGSSEDVGSQPYQQHDGIRVTNRGDMSVDLQLAATDPAGFVVNITLAPDSSYILPPTDGSQPAASFLFTVTNQSSSNAACVEIHENGYRTDLVLGDGVFVDDVASLFLQRSLLGTDEIWSLEFMGGDIAVGNLLDVSAHNAGYVSAVGDGEGTVPGPRPLVSRLLPNVPNPFNPVTQIRFDLTLGGKIDLSIYDTRGRLVRTLVAGAVYANGRHSVTWDGRDNGGQTAASGVYFALLKTADTTDSQQMVLLK